MHFASELTPLTAFMINTIYAMSSISLGSGVTGNDRLVSVELKIGNNYQSLVMKNCNIVVKS